MMSTCGSAQFYTFFSSHAMVNTLPTQCSGDISAKEPSALMCVCFCGAGSLILSEKKYIHKLLAQTRYVRSKGASCTDYCRCLCALRLMFYEKRVLLSSSWIVHFCSVLLQRHLPRVAAHTTPLQVCASNLVYMNLHSTENQKKKKSLSFDMLWLFDIVRGPVLVVYSLGDFEYSEQPQSAKHTDTKRCTWLDHVPKNFKYTAYNHLQHNTQK